ncbi:unnamed protein product, partial [Rhizoctonia solani]
MYELYVCILFASSTFLLWIHLKRVGRRGPLPPSPKSDPLIGNLRVMSKVLDEPKAYRDWGLELGNQKGDIVSITLPGKVIIILNSQDAIDELLVKRSSIYSDRPYIPMVSSENLVGWGHSTGSIRYGERWRFQRKLTYEAFQKTANDARRSLIETQTYLALQRILAKPSEFAQEIRRMAGSTMLTAVYGYEITSEDDSLFQTVETAVQGFSQALIVRNYLVNTIPWLEYIPEWFPGATWKAKANEWRRQRDLMLHVPFQWTKVRMSTGAAPPSMLSSLLTKYMHQESDLPIDELEDCIRWSCGAIFAAGITPIVSSIRVFIMAMAMHPEIQIKAQAEIDGTIAVPHACTQDDSYKGYYIPKGAIVIGNSWAISNNPAIYPDPDRFDPDRFLDPSVPDAPAFGYGRRVCPGVHHADAAMFMAMASLLSVFDIRPPVDEEGRLIPLKAEVAMDEAVRQADPAAFIIAPNSFYVGYYVPLSAGLLQGLKNTNKSFKNQ